MEGKPRAWLTRKRKKEEKSLSSEDEEVETPSKKHVVPNCKHLSGIKFNVVKKHILNPSKWACVTCGSTGDVWACLTCGHISCGRDQDGHAEAHWEETNHPLVLQINSHLGHCYKCDDYIGNDNRYKHIEKLRDLLDKAQNAQKDEEILHFQPLEKDYQNLDKLSTFVKRWRLFYLAKALNKWKEVLHKNPQDSAPSRPTTRTSLSGNLIVPGQTGLRNLGNTCFMNSVLQCLSHLPEFRDFFVSLIPSTTDEPVTVNQLPFIRQATIECLRSLRNRNLPKLDQISVAVQLHSLLRVLWSGKWAVVTPFALLEAVWKFVPRFKNYQQQDAQEFLCCLLDRIHSEFVGMDATPQQQMTTPSIISDIFQGKLQSQIKCSTCGHSSCRSDTFLDLAVDIPAVSLAKRGRRAKNNAVASCTLEECFKSFTSPEILGDESWFCDHCNCKRNATKEISLEELPTVLCVVLKRFSWTSTSCAKIDTKVQFPSHNLDLSPFCTNQDVNAAYDLKGIIVHHGASLQSGHYTAYCVNGDTDTWAHFNDNRVKIASEEEALLAEPYILFYHKKE